MKKLKNWMKVIDIIDMLMISNQNFYRRDLKMKSL